MPVRNERAAALALILAIATGCQRDVAPKAAAAPPAVAQPAPARPPAPAPRVDDPKAVYRVPVDDTPLRGPSDALVTIVEAMDLECPSCREAAPILAALDRAYPGKLRFSFRHNPLPMHARAVPAALLAEEARAQRGDARFWALRDRLLALPALDKASIEAAARGVGLSPAAIKAALAGLRMDRLRRDQMFLYSLGAHATPTFFVNGRKLVGAPTLAELGALVDEELAKAQALVRSGVPARDVYARTIEGGATAAVTMPAPPAAPPARTDLSIASRPDDPVRGAPTAKVTVVEFSDFQCPFCQRALPELARLQAQHGADLRVVFKHLPLPFHPNALRASVAAEAARLQGRFWEMHDKLFASQQALGEAAYLRAASELGLDLDRFRADLASTAVRQRVEADAGAASAAGITGTPSFVVNGELVVGTGGLPAAIDRQLAKAALAKR